MNCVRKVGISLLIIFMVIGGLVCVICPAATTSQAAPATIQESSQDIQNLSGEVSPDEVVIQPAITHQSVNKTTWNSGITPLSNLSAEQKKKVDSLIKHPVNQSVKSATPPIAVPDVLPESFDWRNNNGDWTTPIRDQGEECGSLLGSCSNRCS